MSPLKSMLLAASMLVSATGAVLAQSQAPTYDPAQLPATQGKVAQYTLTPRGDVDGLILQDGTEVHVPPHLSTELVFAVHPGDAVTIHGLKARVLPMVLAMSVTNDATHVTVATSGERGPGPGTPLEAQGKVKAQLHGARGELNGVVLEDGTAVRLPPSEAERLAATLAVGKDIYARGEGVSNPLGRVVAARAIGGTKESAAEIHGPGPGWMHGMMAAMHRGHGPHGHDEMRRGADAGRGPGPDAGPGPTPAPAP